MKRILILIVAFILLLAIPATVYLVSQQQELRKKAAPATTLSLAPVTTTANVGNTFSLEVVLDPGSNQVIATDIELIYDPDILEAQTITNSTLLPSVLTAGTVSRGTASITVGSTNVQSPVTTRGTIAVIKFKALAPSTNGPASVRFAQNSFVGGLGEGQTNLLVGSTPANITVSGSTIGTPTLTPAMTVTLTPTLTPTLSPTLSPTITSTASPTLTPTLATTPGSSSSAVQILTPASNTSVTTAIPTFTGKAPAGSTVTLTIYSTPQTVVLQTDSNGNWTYTPTSALATGPHNVVASATTPNGSTITSTSSFVVAQAGGTSATQSAIPISGDISWTFILIFAGLTLLTLGFIYPIFL